MGEPQNEAYSCISVGVGGVGWEYVTKMAKNDHTQEKHCKLLKSPIQTLYFVPVSTPKHIP